MNADQRGYFSFSICVHRRSSAAKPFHQPLNQYSISIYPFLPESTLPPVVLSSIYPKIMRIACIGGAHVDRHGVLRGPLIPGTSNRGRSKPTGRLWYSDYSFT
jgi:hypothetical protein